MPTSPYENIGRLLYKYFAHFERNRVQEIGWDEPFKVVVDDRGVYWQGHYYLPGKLGGKGVFFSAVSFDGKGWNYGPPGRIVLHTYQGDPRDPKARYRSGSVLVPLATLEKDTEEDVRKAVAEAIKKIKPVKAPPARPEWLSPEAREKALGIDEAYSREVDRFSDPYRRASDLRSKVAKLAHENATLRPILVPLLRGQKMAMEHPSEDARKKYLQEHKNADPKNHTVKSKGDDKSKGKEDWVGTPLQKMMPKREDGQALLHLKDELRASHGREGESLFKDFQAMLEKVPPQKRTWKSVKDTFEKALVDLQSVYTREELKPYRESLKWVDKLRTKVPRGKPETKTEKPKAEKSKTEKPKWTRPKLLKDTGSAVAEKYDLKDADAEALAKFKKSKPKKGKVKLTDAELMKKFLANAKPETKERMKGMSPAEFVKILGAIMDEEGAEG